MNPIHTLLAVCALSVFSCVQNQSAGGTTVETENTVAVRISFQDGSPAANASVRIRPMWFVSDTAKAMVDTSMAIRDLETDAQGRLYCKNLPAGVYMLDVMKDDSGAVTEFNHTDTVKLENLSPVILGGLGVVRGKVQLPSGTEHAWVQIYGLERLVRTDSAGGFYFDSLPPGVYHLRAIAEGASSVIAEDLVQLRSGYFWNIGPLAQPSVYMEDPETWRYSQEIPIDSLTSDWMRPLSDPAVLELRLDSSNFDFSQAMSDGRDFRVFDESANRLVIQRARWDSDAKTAVIRIRIEGMEASSRIKLSWGCPGALDPGSAGLWNGISDSLYLELYSLLAGDFEEGTTLTSLPSPIVRNYWYVYPQDTSVDIYPTTDNAVLGIQEAGAGRNGHAYHISYTAPTNKYALMGLSLNTESRNFSALDSVVFWARGSGYFYFALEAFINDKGKAIYRDTLDSTWTRICVRPADFLEADVGLGGNVGWAVVKDSITNMSFFAEGGTDFWVDSIRIYGLNRDDMK